MAAQLDTPGSQQPVVGEEDRCRRPAPLRADDLVILVRDDNDFYWLKKADYQNEAHRVVDSSMVSQAKLLVEQGVVLADIPVGSIPGVGMQCYLLNLSGIRRREAKQPCPMPDGKSPVSPPPVDPKDPCLHARAPAIDDLVILSRDGATVYWVKKCEYKRPECRLDKLDPILAEQLRLLTNQGVVLADVPGCTLPGVDDMGCLVNLRAIDRPPTKKELAKQQQTRTEASGDRPPNP